MIRHGNAPFLECSSAGDRRLSAFYAPIKARDNKTIETIYQAAKVFSNGDTGLSIAVAKGFRPVNVDETRALYAALWDEYMAENPELLTVIARATGLSDRFARPGGVCQATELWRIREDMIDVKNCTYCGRPVFAYTDHVGVECDELDDNDLLAALHRHSRRNH